MPQHAPPNVARMYLYGFLAECLLIVPILIPLYLSQGLSATAVFLVQAVFTVGVFVMEVPSGYLSDTLGRRRTLILAAGFWTAGFAGYALASSFLGFALSELCLAVGASLKSGTDTALVYDSLQEHGRDREFTGYQGRVELATRIGGALAAVAGGFLGAVLLRLPVYLNIATAALMLAISLGFVEPQRSKPRYTSPLRGMNAVVSRCLRDPRLLWPMLLLGFMTSASIIGIWSYLLLFQKNDLGAAATGVIFAAFQLASGLGAKIAGRLEGWLGARRTWALFPLVGAGLLLISIQPRVYLCAVVMVVNAAIWGLSNPLLMARINQGTSSDIRATVISVGNMIGRLFYVIAAPLVGQLADRVSLRSAFAALGVYALSGTVLALVAYRSGPSMRDTVSSP